MAEFRLIPHSLSEWWAARSEMQRDVWNMGFVVVGASVFGLIGWWWGVPKWKEWRQGTAIEQVEQFAEQGDYRSALLALRRATESDPSNPAVWQRAAEFLARIGSPEVVVARRNLTRLRPEDMGLKVALVTEALRFSDLESAQEGLFQLEEGARRDAAFFRLAAAVALAMGQQADLENHLKAMLEAAPDDYAARFNLAAVQAWSTDDDVAAAALVELARLCAHPEVQVRAALERLKLAALSRDPVRVDQEVAFLLRSFDPEQAGMSPLRTDPDEPPGWDLLLDKLRDRARGSGTDASLLARWMADIGLELEALNWVKELPNEVQQSNQLTPTMLDLAASTNDLEILRKLLESGRLGRIPLNTVNLALAARIQALEFGGTRGMPTWEDAIATSVNSLAGLRVLARLGGVWGDEMEVNLALEKIVELYPREFWACEALRVNYAVAGDMEMLWRLYQIWAPRVPHNTSVQTTWIMLAAVLNRIDNRMLEVADRVWSNRTEPVDPAVVLAMIAAVWRSGSIDTAERFFDQLPVGAERNPRALLWRAILASDQDDEATLSYALRNLPRESLMQVEVSLLEGVLAAREQRQLAQERREQLDAQGPISGVPGGTARIPSAGE